jgi:integrase
MVAAVIQLSKVGKTEETKRPSPNSRSYKAVRSREYLFPKEVEAMREAVRKASGRHAHRDTSLILLMYRHGFRVAEVAALKWEQIDFTTYTLHVRRVKRGTPSTHPLYGDEIRALRKLQRDYPDSPYIFQSSRKGPLAKRAGELAKLPFPVHAHMLRHGCGYYLASENTDTRTIQAYLGHRNIQHTVRYTELSPGRFKGLWKE